MKSQQIAIFDFQKFGKMRIAIFDFPTSPKKYFIRPRLQKKVFWSADDRSYSSQVGHAICSRSYVRVRVFDPFRVSSTHARLFDRVAVSQTRSPPHTLTYSLLTLVCSRSCARRKRLTHSLLPHSAPRNWTKKHKLISTSSRIPPNPQSVSTLIRLWGCGGSSET